jgi:YD repeat-containing protein
MPGRLRERNLNGSRSRSALFVSSVKGIGSLTMMLVAILSIAPASASAEPLCTDTWTGASEGTWQTATNWSTGKVPSSTDVACIGAGYTVNVTAGTNQAGVIEDKGTLGVLGGLLEVLSTLEASSIANLSVENGAELTGSAEVDVTGTFTGGSYGVLAGTGSTVIESGATGTVTPTGGEGLYLEERTLRNAGTLTIGEGSGLGGSHKAHLVNSGTLILNGSGRNENHGLIASSGEAFFTNAGTVKKTEGTKEPTPVEFEMVNEGTVTVTAGKLEITEGNTSEAHSGGSWSASGAGTDIVFNLGGLPFSLGTTVSMSGSIEIKEGTVTAGKIEGATASIVIIGKGIYEFGELEVDGSSPSTLQNLTLTDIEARVGATLTGSAEVDITNSFSGGGYSTMKGTGSTVIEAGATGTITPTGGDGLYLEGRTLVNAGTLTVGKGSGLSAQYHARLVNSGTLIVNGETVGEDHGLTASEKEATLINTGTLKKTEGTGETPIEFEFENFGVILEETGHFKFYYPVLTRESSTQYGGGETLAPGQAQAKCGDPVSCATGNYSETQTDIAVGGRGVGLNLTRTYNSQAGAEGSKGAFGYGWTSSFSDHLVVNKTSKVTTLYQANGSTVPFTEGTGGSFTASAWTQDTLSGTEGSGFTLTLASQVKYKFAGASGRLESVSDRDGNATTLTYNEAGQLTTITDPTSRKIKLAYNGEGLIESAEDPMKHVVKYTYEAGNLKSVTQPAEAALRWQFKYDGSHQLTELTDGRGGKTVNEYNASHQVTLQKDPAGRELSFEYEAFRTKITNKTTGSVTDEHFTSNDEPASITRGYGTSSATTESFTYNEGGYITSVTDGDGHTTTYG